MHGVGYKGKLRGFIRKRIHQITYKPALRTLSQDGVLYKRPMHINEITFWP